jgi:Predicted glycosyltransferases
MSRRHIPQAVLDAAHARSSARAAGDWVEADRLRAEIETSGWKIMDRGTDFGLSPMAPPDETDGERVRYGSSASVPSRSEEAATGVASVVLIATDRPDDLARTLAGLRANTPLGTSIVIVADGPSEAQAAALDDLSAAGAIEVVWTAARLGDAAATNIGLCRASGPVVVLLDPSIEPTGDIVTPLVRALDDPTAAVVGGWGLVPGDVRAFEPGPAGDVDAIEGVCQAFRRVDVAERGPIDERFRSPGNLAVWWSLVLRDPVEGETPRRAVRLDGLPVIRHVPNVDPGPPDPERARQEKRDRYRIIDRFGPRPELLSRE